MCLFILAVLGLCCYVTASSSCGVGAARLCGEQLLIAVTSLLCCRVWATGHAASVVEVMGLVALGMWDPAGAETEPMFPTLAGRPPPLGHQESTQHIVFGGYNSIPRNCNSLDTFYVFRIALRVLTVESYLITPTTLPARSYYHPSFTCRDPDAQRNPAS